MIGARARGALLALLAASGLFAWQLDPKLNIAIGSLPAGEVGSPYSATLTARGGQAPYTWAIIQGVLPSALSLNSSTGVISGIPGAAGLFPLTVQVTDAAGDRAVQPLQLSIAPALAITTTTLTGGTTGTAYSASLSASGGLPPYTWSLASGSLPAGITLGSDGALSGTPTSAGTFSFTVMATDTIQTNATASYSVTVQAGLRVTTSSLPDGTVGVSYSQALSASGGTPPYSWRLTGGSLPPGLTLAASGTVAGTPSAAGNFSFPVQVTDSASRTASGSVTLRINPAALNITTSTLPGGTVGTAYSATFAASGGTPPYQWSSTGGTLPPGVALSASGALSGTPTTAGNFSFTVQVTDSSSATASGNFSVAIAAPALSITTSTLPGANVGAAYSQALGAAGGTPPYTWSIATGNLPAGLSLSTGGTLSGTPTAAGNFSFTVQVTDSANSSAKAALSLAVAAPALSITTSMLPGATVGTAYSQALAASGGTPPYTWSIAAGSLPPGVTLSAGGALAGTPTAAGNFSFTVQVSDAANSSAKAALSLAVAAPALSITTSTLPGATVGTAYSQALTASGGTPPYTWGVAAGSLPPGVTLSAGGMLSGTPAAAGNFSFTVQATDAANASAKATVSLAVTAPTLSITTAALPPATVGSPYSQTLSASGGTPPYTWSLASGLLPASLSLSPAGTLSGTPTAAVTAPLVVQVSDSASASATKTLVLSVSGPTLAVGTTALPAAAAGAPYTQPLSATGGTPPYTWSLRGGSLPDGLTLSPSGTISGAPGTPGTFSFFAQVTDSANATAVRSLSIQVTVALSISTAPSLPGGALNSTYSQTLSVSGGTPPYTWSIASGTPPPGLSLSPGGVLSGTPTTAGNFSFTVQAADSTGATASQPMALAVAGSLSITTKSLAGGALGVAYSDTVAAAGGVPPYRWSVQSGSLPGGISLDASTGKITGTPSAAGTFNFTAQATDSASAQASAAFTLTVSSSLTITTAPALPAGMVGAAYSRQLDAAAGAPAYVWSVTAGAMPPGMDLNSSTGLLSGKPTQSGSFQFTVRVGDSKGASATKAFTLAIAGPLVITTAPALPDGMVAVPYDQALAAAGGTPPLLWSVSAGALPPGLALDPASGELSGTPSANGTFQFTVQVADSSSVLATRQFAVSIGLPAVPTLSLTGLPDIAQPADQPVLEVALAVPYPVQITGQLVLAFQPDPAVGTDDPAVQFATGGRTVSFTIPASATHASFSLPQMSLQTGTVAGTIQVSVAGLQAAGGNLSPPGEMRRSVRVNPGAPGIRSVSLVNTAGGFEVRVVGFSTSRQLAKASVQFTGAASSNLQTTQVDVPLSSVASQWYGTPDSVQYGSQFTLTLPFNVQGGAASSIASVSVTLSNDYGTSAASSAHF